VLESVTERANWILAGERDLAVAGRISLDQFSEDAREVIEWSREHLSSDARRFLGDLPLVLEGEGFACAHAEFECPQRFSYLDHPGSILGSLEAIAQPMLFVGHTRLPSVTEIRPNHSMKTFGIDDFQLRTGCRYLINVGSVGDPRDGNPRTCYCVYDTETYSLEFRRVAFDVPTWDVEISMNELPIQPYVISVLKQGVRGEGGPPDDFIPGLPAEVDPPVLKFASPLQQVQVVFDGAQRTRAPTTDAESATEELDLVSEDVEEWAAEVGEEWATEDIDDQEEDAPQPIAVAEEPAKEGKGKLIAASLAALAALGILAATIASIQKKKEYRPPPVILGQQAGNPKPPNKPAKNDNQKPTPKPAVKPRSPQPRPNVPSGVPSVVTLNKNQLSVRSAKFSNNGARYEKGQDKNFVLWNRAGTNATWAKVKLRSGSQKVSILQSGSGTGVEIEVEIDDQVLYGEFSANEVGEFTWVDLGQIILPEAEHYRVTAKVVGALKQPVRLRSIKFENVK
jgi:diadenosine tetraphosphatase ApaH/serine/threonine PP2A family protein phosphatase